MALGRRIAAFGGIALYTLALDRLRARTEFRYVTRVSCHARHDGGCRRDDRSLRAGDRLTFIAVTMRSWSTNAVTVIFSIAPAIAPVIGGWIQVVAGWRAVFRMLTALGCILDGDGAPYAAGDASGPARRVAERS
jgi:DHA1 family bicyclomycin/chloramphenicol resistance-like MFS transporter